MVEGENCLICGLEIHDPADYTAVSEGAAHAECII